MTLDSSPAQSVHDRLAVVFRDVIGAEPPAADVDLIESGLLDSLMLVTLLAELEVTFSITIALEELEPEEIRSLAGLDAIVERSLDVGPPAASRDDSLIVTLREGSGAAVILVPGAGADGTPLALRPLAHALDTDRPVLALAPLRLEPGQRRQIEDMARAYVAAIRVAGYAPSSVIAGISFGGLVAYEIARQLRAEEPGIERLVLFDTRVASRSLGLADHVRFRFAQPWLIVRHVLADARQRLPDASGRARRRVQAWRRRQTELSGSSGPTAWSTAVDIAGQAYRPGDYDGVVTLLVTRDRPLGTVAPERIWSRCVSGPFSVEPIPGGHNNFLRGPHLKEVAAHLSQML